MSLDKSELRFLINELKQVFTTKKDFEVLKDIEEKRIFLTLSEMKQCNDVSVGFITYCKEDGKRYEYFDNVPEDEITGKWREFKVGTEIDEELLKHGGAYIGNEEPENENVIWFDNGEGNSAEIKYDNPIINELFACIRTLQDQVKQLQADVEYLKINGGGGGGTIKPPIDEPDDEEPEVVDVVLALEDGGLFMLEDGGFMILEESVVVSNEPTLSLEDGGLFMLEDGGLMLLENAVEKIDDSLILLENGAKMLLENGNNILLENA